MRISVLCLPLITLLCTLSMPIAAKPVLVCSSILWMPFNWESKNTIKGAGSVIVQQFFAQQDKAFKLVALGSWARCLKSAQMGSMDMVIAAYKTDERLAWATYVEEPIAQDTINIYINENNPIEVNTLEDLSRYVGGGVIGDSYGKKFDQLKLKLKPHQWIVVNRAEQNIQNLARGRLDYTLMNPWNLQLSLSKLLNDKTLPQNTRFITAGQPVSNNQLYFLFSNKSKHKTLAKPMAEFIKQLKQSGQMEKIINNSFKDYKAQLFLGRLP